VSGLPLVTPKSAISHSVVTFLGGMGARSVVHRAAAIVLIAICGYHLLYVLFSRRGHWEFRQLIPGVQDAKDVLQMLKFYFGLTPVRARFGRYNFIEKFEYLAVGWGSVIMIATGVLLWAPHVSLMFFPKWLMDAAFVVHSWEAILAFLAIIVWHMYNVHLNRHVFPMSRIWLTGKIGLHELRENHPLEFEQLLRRQEAGAREEGQDTE
jgi:cytochrome b subunit of formate dehydrogenase